MQQNQTKVNELLLLKIPCPSHFPLFHYFLLQQMLQCEKQKNSNLHGAIDSLSKHNISLKNYIGVSYLFVDVAATLRAVKMYQRRSNLAIELINDVP